MVKKRPTDTNKLAKLIVDISTGEETDQAPEQSIKAKSASKGGAARAKKLTKAKRSDIAKKAAKKRWSTKK